MTYLLSERVFTINALAVVWRNRHVKTRVSFEQAQQLLRYFKRSISHVYHDQQSATQESTQV